MSFSVYINSNIVSSNPSNATYMFNWAAASQGYTGKYKLTFKFQSKIIGTISATNSLKMLCISGLGSGNQCFAVNSTGSFDSTTCIGFLNMNNAQNAYCTIPDDNPPVILNSLPSSNQFQITIINDTGSIDTYINTVDYLLILFFEKYEE